MKSPQHAPRATGNSPVVPVRLSADLLVLLDAQARREGVSRSDVMRRALRDQLCDEDTTSPRRPLRLDVPRLRAVCERFGVAQLQIFGSYARGEATPTSDVDLLYTLKDGVRLGWVMEDLAAELTQIFRAPVDLVALPALHEAMRADVEAEATVIYAAA